jgi:hypothetical protein
MFTAVTNNQHELQLCYKIIVWPVLDLVSRFARDYVEK